MCEEEGRLKERLAAHLSNPFYDKKKDKDIFQLDWKACEWIASLQCCYGEGEEGGGRMREDGKRIKGGCSWSWFHLSDSRNVFNSTLRWWIKTFNGNASIRCLCVLTRSVYFLVNTKEQDNITLSQVEVLVVVEVVS